MAKPKKTAKYDLKAADRKRNLFIQIGLTAVVVLFAAGLVLYIVTTGHKRPASGEARAVHVAAPSLIVWGREDRIVPLECGERYAKALGQAKLEVVEGAGHFVEMEKPEALASLVTRFLTQA